MNSYRVRDYDEKSDKLYLPYDGSRKLYLEYDGFNPSQQNSETWVPYLTYPLQMDLNYNEKKNLLDTYAMVILEIIFIIVIF